MNNKRTLNTLATALLLVLTITMVTNTSFIGKVSASGDPAKLAFLGAPASLVAGQNSEAIKVQIQDASGAPVTGFGFWIYLYCSEGGFYTDSACTTPIGTGGGETTGTGIGLTSETEDLYFKTTSTGTVRLVAYRNDSGYGYASATAFINVVAEEAANLRLFPVDGNGTWTNATEPYNKDITVTAGDWLSFTVASVDAYGNVVDDDVTDQVTEWDMTAPGAYTLHDLVNVTDSVQFTAAGTYTVNAHIGSLWTRNELTITINPGPAAEMRYLYNDYNLNFNISTTETRSTYVSDAFGNRVLDYAGETPTLTTNDTNALITLFDSGWGEYDFEITFNTLGAHSLTLSCTGLIGNITTARATQFTAINTEAGANYGLPIGSYNDSLLFSGAGLKADTAYRIMVKHYESLATITTNSSGGFSQVARMGGIGMYEMTIDLVEDSTNETINYVDFNYQTKIGLSTISGPKGTTVNFTVWGLPIDYPVSEGNVTATFNGTPITLHDAIDNPFGCNASMIVPNLPAGIYTFNVTLSERRHEPESVTDSTIQPFKKEEDVAITVQFEITTPTLTASVNSQNSGHVGETLVVVGNGFAPNTNYNYFYGTQSDTFITNSSGGFTYSMTVPQSTRGVVAVEIYQAGNKISETQFTVLPSIQLNVNSGLAGTTVTVIGNGFTTANPTTDGLAATLGSQTVTFSGLVSNGLGDFNATFTVPSMSAGTYDFTVTDSSSDSAKVTFQVTAASSSSSSSSSSSPTPTPTRTPTANTIIARETSTNQTYTVTLSGNVTATQMSNMTITVNQASSTTVVAFTVTGTHGTQGFGNLTISKLAIPYGTTPVIYIDGVRAANQGYTEDANNYYVWYTTSFSTHEISIEFTTANPTTQPTPMPQTQDNTLLIAAILIVVIAVLAGAVLLYKYKLKKTFF